MSLSGPALRPSLDYIRAMLDSPAEVVPGFFEASLPGSLPEEIFLLHVDCDLYDSTKVVLKLCLPKVAKGGMIILDEYTDQLERRPGAPLAVDEELSGTGFDSGLGASSPTVHNASLSAQADGGAGIRNSVVVQAAGPSQRRRPRGGGFVTQPGRTSWWRTGATIELPRRRTPVSGGTRNITLGPHG